MSSHRPLWSYVPTNSKLHNPILWVEMVQIPVRSDWSYGGLQKMSRRKCSCQCQDEWTFVLQIGKRLYSCLIPNPNLATTKSWSTTSRPQDGSVTLPVYPIYRVCWSRSIVRYAQSSLLTNPEKCWSKTNHHTTSQVTHLLWILQLPNPMENTYVRTSRTCVKLPLHWQVRFL